MAQIVAALTKIVASVAKIAGHLLHIQDARQCISTEQQYRGLTGKFMLFLFRFSEEICRRRLYFSFQRSNSNRYEISIRPFYLSS